MSCALWWPCAFPVYLRAASTHRHGHVAVRRRVPTAAATRLRRAEHRAFDLGWRINIAGGEQTCENLGGSLPCEMESRYLPPGRYLVTVCLGLLDGLGCTESCRDEEFIFPSEQAVIVHWMNDSTVGFDTTGTAASPRDAGVPPATGEEGLPTDPPRMGDGGIPSGSLWTGEEPAPTDDPTSSDASVL